MTKEEKNGMIDELAEVLAGANVVYLADISELDADATSKLRRNCFNKDVSLRVVKNTLLQKAMDKVEGKDFSEMYETLEGPTSIMLSEAGNTPARIIEDFRKKSDKPVLKAAWVEESVYVGDENLKALTEIKSKDELLGEVIGLLQSPAKNVISALQSGGQTIAGLVKTLSEREG